MNIVLTRVKESTLKNYGTFNEQYVGFGNLYLNSEEVNGLVGQSIIILTVLKHLILVRLLIQQPQSREQLQNTNI